MDKVEFNGTQFNITMAVAINESSAVNLEYNRIGQMIISNSIFNGYSTLNFTYTEQYENSIFKSVKDDNTTSIILSIKQNTNGYDSPIELIYIIDECRIQSNNISEQTYRIKAVEMSTHQLYSRSAYYSSNRDPVSLLKEITERSKIFSSKNAIAITEVGEAKKPVEFISTSNETLYSQINRILDMCSSDKSVFFLAFNYFMSQYRIIELSQNLFEQKTNFVRIIPSSEFHTLGDISSFSNVSKMEGLSPIVSYGKYCNLYSNVFDAKNRKWERKKIGGIEEIEKATLPSNDYEFIFREQKQQEKEQFMFIDEYSTADTDTILGKRNRFLMLNGQRLHAESIGDLTLELGNYITIVDNFLENYGGVWMISEVKHWFEKEKFTTTMILSRCFRLKSEAIQRGNEQQ